MVYTGSKKPLIDSEGNIWTITANGIVVENGTPDTSTQQVVQIACVNGVIWQQANYVCRMEMGGRGNERK